MFKRIIMPKSPYLKTDERLSDVISAIQTLGTYRFYKLSTEKWSERICGDASQTDKWKTVFEEHPEFFRYSADLKNVSLILRRQRPKLYDVDTLQIVQRADREARDAAGKARISRAPLSDGELQLLIELAVNLHKKALEDRRDGRWWMPLIIALIGLFGVWLGANINGDKSNVPNEAVSKSPPKAAQEPAAAK
jgi:hypothetical protein